MPENKQSFGEIILSHLLRRSDILVALGVVSIVIMMIIPMPAFMLDLLIALNISIAMAILLISMYMENVLSFSVFPSLLLVVTLFRLALNVSSTRLILLQGMSFGGEIIRAFGNFVVGGNYVVGIVIFLVIMIIQFMVITKGSTRVAEVAARFTLDAMPGKQMSIDADLQNGIITEEEAKQKRKDIQREADFYGAMDGASKFVQGDAIAGMIITAINIIGGLVIGVLQRGEPIGKAAQTYTLLTVGDGLVSQIPALLISVATGIIVTRAASESNLGEDLTKQFLVNPKVYFIVSGVLTFLGMVPGLPTIPFGALAALTFFIGWGLKDKFQKEEEAEILEKEEEAAKQEEEKKQKTEDVAGLLQIEKMELEIGYNLISLVDKNQGGDLLDRIKMLRRQMVLDLGLIVPPVRVRDSMQIKPNEYVILIKGFEVGRGMLYVDKFLAMNVNNSDETFEGIEVKDPVFGLPAIWISESDREVAELSGYSVIDATTVLITHLTKAVEKYAHELLGNDELKDMLENVRANYPSLVAEVENMEVYKDGTLLKVLQNLLKERVSIRNMVPILETIVDKAKVPDYSKNHIMLAEFCRVKLGPIIYKKYMDEEGNLNVITLDPQLEAFLAERRQENPALDYYEIELDREKLTELHKKIVAIVNQAMSQGIQNIVFITGFELRRFFARFIMRINPDFAVLSYNELPPDAKITSIGMIEL